MFFYYAVLIWIMQKNVSDKNYARTVGFSKVFLQSNVEWLQLFSPYFPSKNFFESVIFNSVAGVFFLYLKFILTRTNRAEPLTRFIKLLWVGQVVMQPTRSGSELLWPPFSCKLISVTLWLICVFYYQMTGFFQKKK